MSTRAASMSPLEIIRRMDFTWVENQDDVWSDQRGDVPELHQSLRAEFDRTFDAFATDERMASPLGWFIVGSGGRGKTHLLGTFRRHAVARRASFILVDMTDVREFWDTVRQGYIDSLQQPYEGDLFQYQCVLRNVISKLPIKQPVGEVLRLLQRRKSSNLAQDINRVLRALTKFDRQRTLRHQDVVRALVCLNSDDFAISSLGLSWLQGVELDDKQRRTLGFIQPRAESKDLVAAMSWFLGLGGPSLLAFDQLDPICIQAELPNAERSDPLGTNLASGILREIGNGLGALRQILCRTMPVVVCLEQTRSALERHVLKTMLDRFEQPRELNTVGKGEIARAMVAERLARGIRGTEVTPPYSTWPFRAEAFALLANSSPREVLQKCESHRRRCLETGEVRELESFDEVITPGGGGAAVGRGKFDESFERYRKQCDIGALLEEEEEDRRLAPLLQEGLKCLVREASLPSDVDASVDTKFGGGAKTRPLHARLRLAFLRENGREEHFSTRAIQYLHPLAYLNRLKIAMTASGIERGLSFRRLTIVRTKEHPHGDACERWREQFEHSGGVFLNVAEDDLRSLVAIQRLLEENEPDLDAWLQTVRPASKLSVIRQIVPHPLLIPTDNAPTPGNGTSNGHPIPPADSSNGQLPKVSEPAPVKPAMDEQITANGSSVADDPPDPPPIDPPDDSHPKTGTIPLGRRLVAGKPGEEFTVPLREWTRHAVVLAGAGSGKTVLLKRIVEEAVLEGIPSIVIDCGQDLSTLDEALSEPSPHWFDGDADKAHHYFAQSEVVVWTPGRSSGNPLVLDPLPDLSNVADDPEELDQAIDMIRDALRPIVAPGNSRGSNNKDGLLTSTLRYQAKQNIGTGLGALIALLRELPIEAGLGLTNEEKLAQEIADALTVEMTNNPLLRGEGTALDPATLFGGMPKPDGPTRVSIISLVGLPGLEAQQSFVNQLVMTLFGWIKRNPMPEGCPLRGLLVIDEAKDFAPGRKACAGKESIVRLVAQARKYGLGVVFATQNPKDLDHRIIANCSTHVYGKVNSPASIEVVKELIHEKKGSGNDVASLQTGVFYAHYADGGLAAPVKIQVPMCLSRHRNSPPGPEEIVAKAAKCYKVTEG
ncbi:AAA-like domain protein [Planctomycetes bacterium Pan216]|uniref:AAA-like domain protein n=1 Tax=Kolteria novifilia TaxID=2527975 RepID=A0A518B1G1_9BACT|nr:AAA-like domain protein [Planctomycetes bacterium Pan216]